MHTNERKDILITILFYTAIGALVYFSLRYLLVWLSPFVFGVTIAALLRPWVMGVSKRLHVGERTAAILTLTFFYLAAAGIILLFLTILLAQLYELLLRLPDLYTQNIAPLIQGLTDWFYTMAEGFNLQSGADFSRFSQAVETAIRQAAVDGSAKLVAWVAEGASRLPMLLLTTIFTIVISLLTATAYHEVGRFLRKITPVQYAHRLSELQGFLRDTLRQYFHAYTIIMAVTFVEIAAGLWLLQFDYVLPVAAAITLLDLLPLIGSGTILIPWGVVLLAGGDVTGGTGLLFLYGIIAVVRNIMEPRVVGKQIGLHPIATITAMYAGLRIAGVVGLLIAPILVLLMKKLLGNDLHPVPKNA